MPDSKKLKCRNIFLYLRILVVAAGIAAGIIWLSAGDRWQRLGQIFTGINPLVFSLAFTFFIISTVIIGLRWWLLIRAQSIIIKPAAAVKLYFLGWFYNNFMPGSVGGDLIRAWYVTKHTNKRFEAVISVFFDRFIGLFSTLVIAVFFYTIFLAGKAQEIEFTTGGLADFFTRYRYIIIWLIVAVAGTLTLLWLFKPTRIILKKTFIRLKQTSLNLLTRLKEAVLIYCKKPLTMLIVFALTVFVQLLTITGFWLLGLNIGIEVDITYYFVFFTLTWVLGTVPVSIAGAVVVEGMLAYMFIEFASVEAESALALALCQRIVWMLASLPGAVIHLMGAHLPKDFFVDCDKPIS
ncbi:MAG: lysylphosphatidylglycerol synthase transmembrane domain-containing protein [Planctomycetota bacterium]